MDEVREALDEASRDPAAGASERVRPHLDDKVLTSWNGLMISAFAMGGAVLDEPRYAEAARRAAEFLMRSMCDPQTGVLLRRYRQGDAAIPGFLDDYAFFAQALLDLYEAQFDLRHLELAIRLTEKSSELFEDAAAAASSARRAGDANLVLRVKEDYDGAEPSGNSVALLNLLRLAQITGRDGFRESARAQPGGVRLATDARAGGAAADAGGLRIPAGRAAADHRGGRPGRGRYAGAAAHASLAFRRRTAWCCWWIRPRRAALLAAGIPAIAAMDKLDGKAAAYVCRNYTCQLPVSETKQFAELLQ